MEEKRISRKLNIYQRSKIFANMTRTVFTDIPSITYREFEDRMTPDEKRAYEDDTLSDFQRIMLYHLKFPLHDVMQCDCFDDISHFIRFLNQLTIDVLLWNIDDGTILHDANLLDSSNSCVIFVTNNSGRIWSCPAYWWHDIIGKYEGLI